MAPPVTEIKGGEHSTVELQVGASDAIDFEVGGIKMDSTCGQNDMLEEGGESSDEEERLIIDENVHGDLGEGACIGKNIENVDEVAFVGNKGIENTSNVERYNIYLWRKFRKFKMFCKNSLKKFVTVMPP